MALSASLMKFIYVFLVNPLYYDNRIAHDKQMIEELDIAFADKEKMISKVLSENTLGSSMLQTLVFMLITGLLISVFVSVMLKKNNREKESPDSGTPT
jgi:hypothetical protein